MNDRPLKRASQVNEIIDGRRWLDPYWAGYCTVRRIWLATCCRFELGLRGAPGRNRFCIRLAKVAQRFGHHNGKGTHRLSNANSRQLRRIAKIGLEVQRLPEPFG